MNWVGIFIFAVIALLLIVAISYAAMKQSNSAPSMTSMNIKVQSDDGSHGAKTMVLSCMDYRFINDTIKYLNQHREGNFDYFVLAGASLGYNESIEGDNRDWASTFEQHVDLAIQLHHITEIIVVDHMDCGYYQAIYGDAVNTPEKEERKHNFNLHKFNRLLQSKYPQLEFKLLLAYKDDNGNISYKEITDN